MRVFAVAISILLQIGFLIFLTQVLREDAAYVYFAVQVLALVEILLLIGSKQNSSYVIAWVIVILILPVFGTMLYFIWGRLSRGGKMNQRIRDACERSVAFLDKDPEVYRELAAGHPSRKRLAGYLGRKNFPLYKNTSCKYYELGELQFEDMIADMERAQRFIFLETFILSEGSVWDRVKDVLVRKAAEGVEIRLMYDDLGSIVRFSADELREVRGNGIEIMRFNPVSYLSQLYINSRNHQKITVIDGVVGYTGGTNIADEYANLYEVHGHWKDTAVRLEGDAVWSMTVTFLQMWEAESRLPQDYEPYRPTYGCDAEGFFQPFSDGPSNNPDNPAETMYRMIINNAKDYVYILSPYLIIDNTMIDALCTAALGGTDVRVVTPNIGDHWYVHMTTRSNYGDLLKAGVRVYEYTPGFIHAKTVISDDDHCVTGSINMDYRSFHLQFENGVYICGAPALLDIKRDILETLERCEEIQLEDWIKRPWYTRCVQALLRLFAVLF